MSTALKPGLRTRIVINGVRLPFAPEEFKMIPQEAKSTRRLANARTATFRPYPADRADALLFWTFSMSFARAAGRNYRPLWNILASPGAFDFTAFKEVTESFTVPASGFAPRLMRRPFLDFLDESLWPGPNPDAVLAAYATTDSSPAGSGTPTVGAADRFGQTLITPSHTPDPGTTYTARYTALFYVQRTLTGERDLSTARHETMPLLLEEV